MTTFLGPQSAHPVLYDGLRELSLSTLLDELDRVEHLLAHRPAPSHDATRRDFSADALRGRERAIAAEIRRRPGRAHPRPGRSSFSAVAPSG